MADVRFTFDGDFSGLVRGFGTLADVGRKAFAALKGEAERADDAFKGMSVDDVKKKIADLNAEIGRLGDREEIRKKQGEIEHLNAKMKDLLGETKKAADAQSGKQGGGFFGSVFGGVVAGTLAAKGLEAAAGAIGQVKGAMIGGNAEMEAYTTQFSTLLGSTGAAQERLKELAKFGAETPFELPEIAAAEKVLVGFGLTGQKVADLTGKNANEFRTLVGDIAASTGQSFEEISLLFGKMSSGATGESLARFQELGIATKEQLAAMGVEFGKSGELLSPLPVAMEAITKLTAEKFSGGMLALSKTFGGLVSTFQDTLAQMGRELGAPIFEAAKGGLIKVLEVLNKPEIQGAITKVSESLANALVPVIDALIPLIDMLVPVVVDIAGAFTQLLGPVGELIGALIGVIRPILPVITGLFAALVPIIGRLVAVVANVVKAFQPLIDILLKVLAERLDIIMPLLESVVTILEALVPVIALVAKTITPFVVAGEKLITLVLVPIVEALEFIIDNAAAAVSALAGLFGDDAPAPKAVAKVEEGPDPMDAQRAAAKAERDKQAAEAAKKAADEKKAKEAAEKERKRLDALYKAESARLKREEEIALLEAQKTGAKESELQAIRDRYAKQRIDLATSTRQAEETQAQLAHDFKKSLLERDIENAQRAAEAEKQRLETVRAAREKYDKAFDDAEKRARDKERKQSRDASQKEAEENEKRRQDFEQTYARPVAALGVELAKSVFDPQITGAERAKMLYTGLGDIAMNVLTEMATTAIANMLMGAATQATIVGASAAEGAALLGVWGPLATAVSLASFGANSVPAIAGMSATSGVANILLAPKMFASGGIADRPIFTAVAGEAGPEVIAPLRELPGLMAASLRAALAPNHRPAINKQGAPAPMRVDATANVTIGALQSGSRRAAHRFGLTQR